MIDIVNIDKRFGDNHVLKNISVSFKTGEVVAILGSSGSGKSTMLRCINGLEKIDSGDIKVNDLSITNPKNLQQIRQNCGMVFQQFNLFPHLNIIQNITLSPIKILKQTQQEAEVKAIELLKTVGLEEKALFYPSQLSGGQQQRIAIARALAMGPQVLLLDEVTSALDPEMTVEVMRIIEQLAHDGITMLVVTHEMGFAEKVANRILFLDKGIICQDTDSKNFFSSQDPRVIQFLNHAID